MHSHQLNTLKQLNVFPQSRPMREGPTQPTSQTPQQRGQKKWNQKCREVNNKTEKSLQKINDCQRSSEHKNRHVLHLVIIYLEPEGEK